MIQHHLTDEMIAAMAAGTLEAGWALGATTHLTMCSACRARLRAFERIGGYFLECEVANDNLDEGWREMERRITESQWEEDPVTSSPRSETEVFLPEPLATYVDRAGGLKWRF